MRRRFTRPAGLRLALALALAVSLLLGLAGNTQAANPPTQLTTSPTTKTGPRTDGQTVVWQEGRGLLAVRLSDLKVFPVVTLAAPQAIKQFDLDGNFVIWEQFDSACTSMCDGPIYGKNLATGQTFRVSPEYYGRNIAISGQWAAYVTQVPAPGATAEGIRVRNLNTLADPTTVQVFYAVQGQLVMDGDRLLWGQTLAAYQTGTGKERWQLVTMKIGDSAPVVLDQADYDDYGALDQGGWDLQGDLAVYAINRQLQAVNLKTGEHRLIAKPDQRPAQHPTTDGRYIFWEDPRSYNDQAPTDYQQALQGYDFQTASYLGNVVLTGNNTNPQARGGSLVWNSNGGNIENRQIYRASIADSLPTAPRQAFGSANRTYFPATGHYLGGVFQNFWNKHGGLAVFGFPQTEEFEALDPDTGQVLTVQYFERQRYEYHPENKGTPYEVLLGRLGLAEAQRQGLMNSAPFQPANPPTQGRCQWFPATRHKVCDSFADYWQSHGLDLGEPGNSYRESLALFGLPISEPFTDPKSGLLVQYFERARFEYHPENKGTPYEVLLSLLGNQELKTRGW